MFPETSAQKYYPIDFKLTLIKPTKKIKLSFVTKQTNKQVLYRSRV